jgi:hypothetical protein
MINETLEQAAERFYPISKGGSMWMPSASDCNKAEAVIVASYGGYTGSSEDEYPTYIGITDKYDGDLVDVVE